MKSRSTECFAPSCAKLLGALAFAMLIASGGVSFGAQIDFSTSFAALQAGGEQVYQIPQTNPLNDPAGTPEPALRITITDVRNTVNGGADQVTQFEANTGLSDVTLNDNNAQNQWQITMLSDDAANHTPDQLPPGYPRYPEAPPFPADSGPQTPNPNVQYAYRIYEIGTANAFLGFLEVVMVSDGNLNNPNQASDAIVLRVIPEPSTMFMAALALASLVGIAYRRARLAKA